MKQRETPTCKLRAKGVRPQIPLKCSSAQCNEHEGEEKRRKIQTATQSVSPRGSHSKSKKARDSTASDSIIKETSCRQDPPKKVFGGWAGKKEKETDRSQITLDCP